MGYPEINPEENDHSNRVKDGIARARAQGKRWGRPSVIELTGDPDLPARASELRCKGLSWSEIASQLSLSRTTAKRLAEAFQKDERGQKVNCTPNTVPKGHVFDTAQEDCSDRGMQGVIPDRFPSSVDSDIDENTRAISERRTTFIRATIQLVLENEQLTRQVLERIRAHQNVQKHP